MSPFSTSLSPHYFQETKGRGVEAWPGKCTTTSPRMVQRHPQMGSRPTKASAGLWADRHGGALRWEAQTAGGNMLQGKQARRRCGRAGGSTRSSVLLIGEAQLSYLSSSHSKALGRPKTHIFHATPNPLMFHQRCLGSPAHLQSPCSIPYSSVLRLTPPLTSAGTSPLCQPLCHSGPASGPSL